jgi:hypothetical protein
MVYGILRDKERLDAGDPTEITVSYTRHEVSGVDALAQALSTALLQRRKEIDVTPLDGGTAESKKPRSS